MILELLLDALLDSVKMLPFLFAAYWLIEYVEHRHSEGIEKALAGGGRFGFVPGAVLGLLPQCGFSAMAAKLYASKVVTLGTLLAVFLATSDEAVPLLIANPEHWRSLALILGIKLAVALAAGFCIDFVFKRLIPQSVRGGYTGSSSAVDCPRARGTVRHPGGGAQAHAAHLFVHFAVQHCFGRAGGSGGRGGHRGIPGGQRPWQPVLAGLVGLIPNCVSSVLITQPVCRGPAFAGRRGGGVVHGRRRGAGGAAARQQNAKQNLFIVALLYGIGVAAGLVCSLFA